MVLEGGGGGVYMRDKEGNYVAHYAAGCGLWKVVEFFCDEYCFDLMLRNYVGKVSYFLLLLLLWV